MPSSVPIHQWPRPPWNELHQAVLDGSIEILAALLQDGSIGIDQVNPKGGTLLMLASGNGNSRVVRMLIDKGADVSKIADGGFTALHGSVQGGHLAVTKVLIEAGADMEAVISTPTPGTTD